VLPEGVRGERYRPNKERKDFTINTRDTYEFSGWLKEDDYESKKKLDELKEVFNGNDKPF